MNKSNFELLETLPELLLAARTRQALTQRNLAARVGCSERQIQRYEATRYQTASLRQLIKIAGALSIGIS